MVTIKDIAKEAGVSTTTVSNVLHGNTNRVSAQKVELISRLIAEMGYETEHKVSYRKKEKSRMVAVIMYASKEYEKSILADPFFGETMGTIEEALRKKGYYTMLYSAKTVEDIMPMVMRCNIDGIITLSFSRKDCEKIYSLIGKPVVSIDAYGEGKAEGKEIVNIGIDDFAGAYEMMGHLLKCKYDMILFCAARDHGVDHERWLGCLKALEHWQGKKPVCKMISVGLSKAKRMEIIEQICKRKKDNWALFYASDIYAIEAISVCREKGIQIPVDLGICGFDNILYSEFCVPPLTTVKQNFGLKAKMAVDVLSELIQENYDGEREVILPVSLVVRKSCRNQV